MSGLIIYCEIIIDTIFCFMRMILADTLVFPSFLYYPGVLFFYCTNSAKLADLGLADLGSLNGHEPKFVRPSKIVYVGSVV